MDRKEEELLKQLLPMFRVEAGEHLKAISSGLLEFEKCGPGERAGIIEAVYRESHSLKGAARSVNFSDVVAVCQSMENVFSSFKRASISISSSILNVLLRAVGCMEKMVAGETSAAEMQETAELIETLERAVERERSGSGGDYPRAAEGAISPGKPESHAAGSASGTTVFISPDVPAAVLEPGFSGTIRVSADRLDGLLLLAEEMLSVKLAVAQRAAELKRLRDDFLRWKRDEIRTLKPSAGRAGKSGAAGRAYLGEFMSGFESGLTNMVKSVEGDQRFFGTMVDALLDNMKQTLMLPCLSLLDGFPRLVRELCLSTGKEAELSIGGGSIEMDRRVLELVKDPIVHLVRNCVDHGIEMPDDRDTSGKSRRGSVRIEVSSLDNMIEIAVSDDGAGIDAGAVKTAAVKSGVISAEEIEGLDEREALSLVFRSGVSTSRILSDISGRGLGLAIVREKVEKLGGTIALETVPDAGTTVRMVVPLTLATFRGVLVRIGDYLLVVPSTSIERASRIRKEDIKTVENRETVCLDDTAVSLVRLGDVLGLKQDRPQSDRAVMEALVLVSSGKRMVFLVDEVLQEQEVLVKGLGAQLSRVPNIAGATVLGNGRVVPILNVQDLMISASKAAPCASVFSKETPEKKAVLVVEDSITARTLLKSILESAGYDVKTAFDGIDAFAILKADEFDIVVSDIEMPRMNGFELTEKIRADKNLSGLPVVLVTALESREDRERGVDAGADAYIVKSSFEQSNLLDVVRRLV